MAECAALAALCTMASETVIEHYKTLSTAQCFDSDDDRQTVLALLLNIYNTITYETYRSSGSHLSHSAGYQGRDFSQDRGYA